MYLSVLSDAKRTRQPDGIALIIGPNAMCITMFDVNRLIILEMQKWYRGAPVPAACNVAVGYTSFVEML